MNENDSTQIRGQTSGDVPTLTASESVAQGVQASIRMIGRYRIIRLLGEGGMGAAIELFWVVNNLALELCLADADFPRALPEVFDNWQTAINGSQWGRYARGCDLFRRDVARQAGAKRCASSDMQTGTRSPVALIHGLAPVPCPATEIGGAYDDHGLAVVLS